MADDDARGGAELARRWLQGKVPEMGTDLALIVSGMTTPLDPEARAFLQAIGNAAKALAKREARRTPAPPSEATPAAPVASTISLGEMLRRIRERQRAAQLDRLGRSNSEAWAEQAAFLSATRRF
jgi:hypothetical protein